jgi:pimeloyl-ACP methyl ester carboxylesterase
VHADDAATLIGELADGPVLAFGSSLGALLGLELVSRHPGRVRVLVAHEPPATELLPRAERQQAVRAQEAIEDLYRREGVAAAMRQFVVAAGIDFADREPAVEVPRARPERVANLEFFLTHDAPAVRRHHLNLEALHAAAEQIIPAAGQHTRAFPRDCAQALAVELERDLADVPGGHSGFVLHPRAFAARLDELLAAATGSGR